VRGFSATVCLVLLASAALASDAEEIRTFLAVPIQTRLTAALEANDHRYLGVYGFSLAVPGVPDSEVLGQENPVLVIPGTSDDGEFELNERARNYAGKYNRLLRSRSPSPSR
jgi:hypothetical protein